MTGAKGSLYMGGYDVWTGMSVEPEGWMAVRWVNVSRQMNASAASRTYPCQPSSGPLSYPGWANAHDRTNVPNNLAPPRYHIASCSLYVRWLYEKR